MNIDTRERQIATLADDMAQSVNLLLCANEAALGNDSHEYCHWLTPELAISCVVRRRVWCWIGAAMPLMASKFLAPCKVL